MKRVLAVTLFGGVFAFAAFSTLATTIHVPADQPTIQAGIDAATSNDTVLVSSGSYSVNISFGGKEIVLLSESGVDSTTISQASRTSAVITFDGGEGTGAEISGFTFSGAFRSAVIRINDGSPWIHNNIFTGNDLVSGSGILVVHGLSHPTITYNLFYDNSAVYTFRTTAC